MQYKDLDSYVNYLRSYPRQGPADFLQLKRIREVLNRLGNPEKKLGGIQVAGTNGKGSTVAILKSVLTAAGYKVGVFTSPHVVTYTERIAVNNRNISQGSFVRLIEKVRPIIDEVEKRFNDRLTWFELITVVAILYFVEQKVDLCVFEVGLGGRLDATTVLPLKYKVITNIALDHTHILGRTIGQIAQEKAGIINQRGLRVVTATSGKALVVAQKEAAKFKAKLLIINNEGDIACPTCLWHSHGRRGQCHLQSNSGQVTWQGTSFNVQGVLQLDNLKLSLIGRHQIQNALCALGAIYFLQQDGYQITEADLRAGFKRVRWLGRFQVAANNPRIVIDASHNPAGVRTLIQAIKDLRIKPQDLKIIFGVKKTKEYKQMLRLLKPVASKIYFFSTANKSLVPVKELKRAFPSGQILKSVAGVKQLLAVGSQRTAVGSPAKELKVIVVTGSIYFLGDFIQRVFSAKVKRYKVDQLSDNQLEKSKL